MYRKKSIERYLNDLAARLPAPGGGSAAALAGALGCALLSMVCNFTIGKEKYRAVEGRMREILQETERIRKRLTILIDLDVKAYYKVSNSRKKREDIYQRSLIFATGVPLEICRLAVEAHKFCPYLAEKANKYLISDVYVAQELLKSSFKSGELNVKINLPAIEDRSFIFKTNKIITTFKKSL